MSAPSDVLTSATTRFSRMTVASASDAVNVRDFGSASPESKESPEDSFFLPCLPICRIAKVP